MRPEVLFPLFTDVRTLEGIGPRMAELIGKVCGRRIRDVLLTPPSKLVERRNCPSIGSADTDEIVTLTVTVGGHSPGRRKQQPYKVLVLDETGNLDLTFFNARPDYLRKVLPEGTKRVISGKIEKYRGVAQMTHPDYIFPPEQTGKIPEFETQYPLTAGLTQKMMRKAVAGALNHCPNLPEWLDQTMLAKENWPEFPEALQTIHTPESKITATANSQARQRLAYDELFSNQLALALTREHARKQKGRRFEAKGAYVDEVRTTSSFTPTNAQTHVFEEIRNDLTNPRRMSRLLQGDVGSGKTFVAALTCAHVAEAGAQIAIMAPTEILARQLKQTLKIFLEPANLNVAALTGADRGGRRDALLRGIKEGHIDVICGTHALFQEGVEFADLGLVIIDEQHRFGVQDRFRLTSKGKRPDILVMTATPIPRTLALAAYSDLDISILGEKPAGRKPVETRAVPIQKLHSVADGLERAIAEDNQIYWVCPLVEDSDLIDLASVEERFRHLSSRFGDKVGLLHGKLSAKEKEAVSESFKRGNFDILVATTVIEVGIDAPNATIMVIEHAERFGLAQLHQLRGRVGRNDKESACILLYKRPLTENAKTRLNILRETDNGFLIAEEDWNLRGSGDLLGSRQSGLPVYRLADIDKHKTLLETAVKDARLLSKSDPKLETQRGQAARVLLYLFEREIGVSLMQSA